MAPAVFRRQHVETAANADELVCFERPIDQAIATAGLSAEHAVDLAVGQDSAGKTFA